MSSASVTAVSATGMGPRIRYTMLAITINTNKAATSAAQEQVLKEDLRRFVTERLTLPEVWAKLINITPSFDAVDHIDVSAIGIERGARRHRIHVHFVVTIQHHGKVNWRGTQRLWQTEVNSFLTYASSSNVSVDLLNARSLNYVTKGSGSGASTGKALAVLGVQEAVVF